MKHGRCCASALDNIAEIFDKWGSEGELVRIISPSNPALQHLLKGVPRDGTFSLISVPTSVAAIDRTARLDMF